MNISIDFYFSSYQLRAVNTLNLILNTIRKKNVNITKAWQLNERHYGSLTGLNKDEMKKKLGEKKVHEFRRSWDIAPEPLSKNNPYHPINIDVYKNIPKNLIPDTESLKDTYERVFPYFEKEILKKLNDNKNILISAHGNSIRAICKFLFKLNEEEIPKLEIPTGNPLFIELINDKIKKCYYLDKERANNLIKF